MAILNGPSAPVTSSATLEEMTALALAAGTPFVAPPAPEQSLTSYVAAVGGGRTVADVMASLGLAPALAARVDQGLQSMPASAIEGIAAVLGAPVADVVWACGGRVARARAPGAPAPDAGLFVPLPAPVGTPAPGPAIAPLRAANPIPRPPRGGDRLVSDMGPLITDLGDYLTPG